MAWLSRSTKVRRPSLAAPALAWALMHVPLVLLLYASLMRKAVSVVPPAWQWAVWPTFVAQAAWLAFLIMLPGWVLLPWPNLFCRVVPALLGLGSAVLLLDSQVYAGVGFHLNGFFLRVMLQPHALAEVGLAPWQVLAGLAASAAWVALDVTLGAAFIMSKRAPQRHFALGVMLILGGYTFERVYGQWLEHVAGPAALGAASVLPLQVPVRMGAQAAGFLGEAPRDPLASAAGELVLPKGLDPAAVHMDQRPDVVFMVMESAPHEHLDATAMPNMWRHAQQGARFTRHYSSAAATHYSIFSLAYGLGANKLETTVGAGRPPMLFAALRAQGYRVKILAASCVEWMDLKQTVFGGEGDALETWCEKPMLERDRLLVQRAKEIAAETPSTQPVFLFLFLVGTHFDYAHDAQDTVFIPEWDGQGGLLTASGLPGARVRNRARNAAHTVDQRLEEAWAAVLKARGKEPLVFLTGDHGEEFWEQGHLGHGSDVTEQQIHVPAAWFGPGIPAGAYESPTSHVDAVATLLAALGDKHAPSLYGDGINMFDATPRRFVVATVGWEPKYAVIGSELKVHMMAGLDATVTTPQDAPLEDGMQRLGAVSGDIVRALRGD